jgi:hypothetical protein
LRASEAFLNLGARTLAEAIFGSAGTQVTAGKSWNDKSCRPCAV